MNSPHIAQSPTGRLSVSMPEMQFFPGTPQALAESRKLQLAREAASSAMPLVECDYSELELRALQSHLGLTL